ncbi:endonuclease [Prevotella sp. P6B1]|uniref:endonuclease n=1 Tax=Prevotella sp. P6B1 TaxID=1410613 RepID=UPI000AF75F86|nr:endonuclease [Prevotella sp. P6B1]
MKKSLLFLFVFSVCSVWAQGPNETGTYYQAADGKKAAELKSALFAIISPHTIQKYTYGVWDAIESYDLREDGKIWEIYSSISNFTPKTDRDKGDETVVDEGLKYNREHAMPKSWFNEATQDNYSTNVYPMYTDLHHLFPTDRIINTMRSNYPYGEVGNVVTKKSEGGFSKFGRCKEELGYKVNNQNGRVFEPNDEYKGDLARVYFYMATAYESYTNEKGETRSPANWTSDMLASNVYPFFTEWALNMLLRWAANDPVSEKEIKRNQGIYEIQGNRNPFVDYPGLEQYIWGSKKEDAFSYDNYVPVTSGIEEITKTIFVEDDGAIYNLRGQRVDGKNLKKGIYIRKNKKVIVE